MSLSDLETLSSKGLDGKRNGPFLRYVEEVWRTMIDLLHKLRTSSVFTGHLNAEVLVPILEGYTKELDRIIQHGTKRFLKHCTLLPTLPVHTRQPYVDWHEFGEDHDMHNVQHMLVHVLASAKRSL